MKLLDLTLTRFGHFAGAKLSFGDGAGLFLVHGSNEAGKTTALHAVRALLFGIPVQARQYAHAYPQSDLRIDALIELSGGLRAELARTKGRKETLHTRLLSGGESVDEGWLNDKLGRPNKDLYNQVFAFSLDVLADGAALLASEAVQGALYGAGFGGTVRPAEIMGTLEEQKGALFKERGTSTTINTALRELAELGARVRGAVKGSEVYDALERDVTAATSAAAAKEGELARAQAEHERLRTLLRAIDVFALRAEDLREREQLAVPARFDPAFAAATVRAFEDETRATIDLSRAETKLVELQTELASLPLAPDLVAARSSIQALERSLELQKAMREEARSLEATERAETARVEAELSRLRPRWTLTDLATKSFPEGQVQRLRELLETDRSLRDTVRAATTAIESAEEAIAREASLSAALPEPEPEERIERLEAWVASARSLDDGGRQREEAAQAVAAMDRRETQLRARLRPLPAAPLEALAPPSAEQIEAARVVLSALEARRTATAERLREAAAALNQAEVALQTLDAHDRAPSEAELTALRRERDAAWDDLARRITHPAATTERPSAAELRGHAERVVATDRLADELRWRADAVQKRLRYEEERAQAAATHARLGEELARHEAAKATAAAAWEDAWAETGIAPGTPDAMRAWRSTWEEAVALAESRAPAEARLTTLREREAAFVREGRELVGDEAGAPTTTLRTVRAQAEGRVQRIRERERQREAHARSELERRRERDRAVGRRDAALAEQETWARAWVQACADLGLSTAADGGDALSPADARVVLAPLVNVQRAHREGQAQRTARRRELEMARAAFETEVRERLLPVAVRVGVAIEGRAAEDETALFSLVERVHEALGRAEKAATRHDQLLGEQKTRRDERAQRLEDRESARQTLAIARAAAGTDDDARIREICDRAGRASELRASIERAHRELARLRGEQDVAAFLRELASTSRPATEQAIASLKARIADLGGEVAALHQAAGALGEKRLTFDSGSHAAELLAEREAVRTRLREAVEAYATAAMAHEILQRNIKRFEREHKPQLLARAEELFRVMTDSAFVAMAQDVDGAVLVERPNGDRLRTGELSTGTAEQLFLALRLAYIEAYEAPGVEPLPVVLDDVLVNFDDARALATLRALVAFAQRNQVLFFTCHAHLVALAREANLGLPVLELPARVRTEMAPPMVSSPPPAPLLLESPTVAASPRRRKKSG